MMVMILTMKIIFQALDNYVKNIVPIKDINKKVCSQVYLKECGFINDSYNKNG